MNIQTPNVWFLYNGFNQDFKLSESQKDLIMKKTQKINIISYILVGIDPLPLTD